MDVITVELKELDFQAELAVRVLALLCVELLKDEVKNTWNYANLIRRQADCAACSHRESLATTCLTIGKNCRIITLQTPKDQVA